MYAHNPILQKLKVIDPSPFGSSQMTKNMLEIFLIKLCRNTEILDYLKDHIYGKVTLKELAKHLEKSESSVKQLFAQYREGGIIRYYNELKIKETRRLIREGNYNMTQISDMLQFDNPQYFSKCFKTVMNMTPSEYKMSIMSRL
jgi:AraC-like DNA-binding protein